MLLFRLPTLLRVVKLIHMELIDPITLDVFQYPVLASDGMTYSMGELQKAMQTDPWHRSPHTYEVLRPLVYPNNFVAEFTGSHETLPPGSYRIFEDNNLLVTPTDGHVQIWSIALKLSANDSIIRHAWSLPTSTVLLTARLRRDHNGLDWLMHPPCTDAMRIDCINLANMFGVSKSVQNSWCLTAAEFSFPGIDQLPCTVESWWEIYVKK